MERRTSGNMISVSKLSNAIRRIFDACQVLMIKQNKNVILNGKIIITGRPLIQIDDGAKLIIDNNVTLNSRNLRYHVNMHSPVKLFANNKLEHKKAVIKIGENSRIHGSCIHAYERVVIGKNCLIAGNCQIFDGSGHSLAFDNPPGRINTIGDSKPIIIGDNVWIGANCIILPGVKIGEGSVVSAGSVIYDDVPPYCITGGNPSNVVARKGPEFLNIKTFPDIS